MQINIFPITSPIHNKKETDSTTAEWIGAISQSAPDCNLKLQENNFLEYGTGDLNLIYIRTGGTENLFREIYNSNPMVCSRKVLLLTSGTSNSLAASMEILSWLRQQGKEGAILHGTAEYVAQQIELMAKVSRAKSALHGQKIGIIGKPSDWLIASTYNPDIISERLGITTEEIDMQEFLDEIRKHDYPISARKRIKTCPSDYFIGALEIYGALKRIIDKHQLNALTVRCFDLLSTVRNTGCLALALLNQEGVPSSCEGDVPALLTMMISQALTGETGFQANPSRINPQTDECVFAHCTIPLNMIDNYDYDTHFESGIGVAIRGKMPNGAVTLAKVSGDMERYYVEEGTLAENLSEQNLCRTQVKIILPGSANYFLSNPIGNHHIIIRGARKALFEEFFK